MLQTAEATTQLSKMLSKTLIQLSYAFASIGATLAGPLAPRQECDTCAVCDVGPGDCAGDDLVAYNACVANTLARCGKSCGSLDSDGAISACTVAEGTTREPCQNACVQSRLATGLTRLVSNGSPKQWVYLMSY